MMVRTKQNVKLILGVLTAGMLLCEPLGVYASQAEQPLAEEWYEKTEAQEESAIQEEYMLPENTAKQGETDASEDSQDRENVETPENIELQEEIETSADDFVEQQETSGAQTDSIAAEELDVNMEWTEDFDSVQTLAFEGSADGIIQNGSFNALNREQSSAFIAGEENVVWEKWDRYLYDALMERSDRIEVKEFGISTGDFYSWYAGVINEHPDLFFCGSYSRYSKGGIVTAILPVYKSKYTREDDAIFRIRTDEALSVLSAGMTDLEKAIALHDYIVENTEYDYQNYLDNTVPNVSHSAYGILVNRIGVCNGYALAYKHLLNQAGIECYMVSSSAMHHAWNMVKLDGHFYQVDTTWDDPTWDRIGRVRHAYMFLSDAAFGTKLEKVRNEHYGGAVMRNGKVVDVKADSTLYDNAFWVGIDTPLVSYGDRYYFAGYDKGDRYAKIYSCQKDGQDMEVLFDDNCRWMAWDGSGSWGKAYTGAFLVNGRLYFNTPAKIMSVSMSDGSDARTEYEPDTSKGYIYGSTYRDGKVMFCLRKSPHVDGKEEIYTALISDIRPVERITLDKTELTLTCDETATLIASVAPENAIYKAVRWASSNQRIASVTRDGLITAQNGGECVIIAMSDGIKASCKMTVRPSHQTVEYKITYYLKGGINSGENPTCYGEEWESITLMPATREGYAFGGWYRDSNLTKKVRTIPKGSKGNKKFYAKWKANRYTVKFEKNGALRGKMSTLKNKAYGKKFKLPANKFKREGYTFVGWNTEPDGTGVQFKNKESVKNLTAESKGMVILYAQWKEK